MQTTRTESALQDPSRSFEDPQHVLDAPDMSREEKLRILKQWELDARSLAVAEEEGMNGGESNRLKRVLDALKQLGEGAEESKAGTKH